MDEKNDIVGMGEVMLLLPQRWLETLLGKAEAFDKAMKDYTFSCSDDNHKIIWKCAALSEYAKTSGHVVSYNMKAVLPEGVISLLRDFASQVATPDNFSWMQNELLRFLSEKGLTHYKEVEAHECRYCGMETVFPDEQCYKAPQL